MEIYRLERSEVNGYVTNHSYITCRYRGRFHQYRFGRRIDADSAAADIFRSAVECGERDTPDCDFISKYFRNVPVSKKRSFELEAWAGSGGAYDNSFHLRCTDSGGYCTQYF